MAKRNKQVVHAVMAKAREHKFNKRLARTFLNQKKMELEQKQVEIKNALDAIKRVISTM